MQVPAHKKVGYDGIYSGMLQIRVHVPSQTLELLDKNNELIRRFVISTSKFGLGFEPGSNRTPTGDFVISDKIGEGAPLGEVFVGRVPTGRIGLEDDLGDNVQTRILWLDGVEPENENTKLRYIYIHGTNAEGSLGTPSSHGCIRMGNQDITELFDLVPVGTPVHITAEG
jgi:lipoprotein-anchoring transpeptidase ErfK/SrfK